MKFKTTITRNLKGLLWLSFCFSVLSCIPLKIAPNIEGAKIYKGKKFKKQLPKQHVYVFNDPKNANDFYYYINAKFGMDYDEVGGNVPIKVAGKDYFLTFYEVERTTKTVNLIPIAVNVALDPEGNEPFMTEADIHRFGSWYIALTVSDDDLKDSLKEDDPARASIIDYLDNLRNEYLSTANYMDIYFKS